MRRPNDVIARYGCCPVEESLGIQAYLNEEQHGGGFDGILKGRFSDFVVHEGKRESVCLVCYTTALYIYCWLVPKTHTQTFVWTPKSHSRSNLRVFLFWYVVALDGTMARLDTLDAEPRNHTNTTTVGETTTCATEDRKRKRDTSSTCPHTEDVEKRESDALPTISLSELTDLFGDTAGNQLWTMVQQQQRQTTSTVETEDDSKNSKNNATPQDNHTDPSTLVTFVDLPSMPDKDRRRATHDFVREKLPSTLDSSTLNNHVIRVHIVRSSQGQKQQQPLNSKFKHNRSKNTPKYLPPDDCPFLRFVLYKENMETGQALHWLKKQQRGRVKCGFAGMKDKRGVTTQFVTVPASTNLVPPKPPPPNSTATSKWMIGNLEYVKEELVLGKLQGNRFEIALRRVEGNPIPRLESFHKGFINYFGTQRFGRFQDNHLVGVAVLQKDFEKAVDLIMEPKSGERPNIYEARCAWKKRFTDAAVGGNEVLSVEMKSSTEVACASKLVPILSKFSLNNEVAILQSLKRYPLDYRRAFSCIPRTMRMMYVHAFQSWLWNHAATHRVRRYGAASVVVGDLVAVPPKAVSSTPDRFPPAVHTVTQEDVEAQTYRLSDVVLPLLGSKTIRPSHETSDEMDDKLREFGLEESSLYRLDDRDFNAKGDYRKLVCMPQDVQYQYVGYDDPTQPLIETDWMKLPLGGVEDKKKEGFELRPVSENSLYKGVVVGFTLPSSSYATMAIRELMKRPTSFDAQKDMSLEDNNNERNDDETDSTNKE